jgi:fatty acid-binding protein DegV
MAPIERVWDALARRVDNLPVKPTTGATLRQALLEEWNNMIRNQDFVSIALSSKRSVTEVKWRLVEE